MRRNYSLSAYAGQSSFLAAAPDSTGQLLQPRILRAASATGRFAGSLAASDAPAPGAIIKRSHKSAEPPGGGRRDTLGPHREQVPGDRRATFLSQGDFYIIRPQGSGWGAVH